MEFDSYDPTQTERLIDAADTRPQLRAARAVNTELVAAAIVLVAASLFVVHGVHHFHVVAINVFLVVVLYVICQQIKFNIGPAFTFPIQLAFVPMLVLLPTPFVPAVVIACRLVLLLGQSARSRASVMTLGLTVADCAYTLGPVLVLVLAHEQRFNWASWPVYCAAMAAQIAVDLIFGLGRSWFAERTSPREFLPVLSWLYLTDICLTCIAVFVAAAAQQHAGLVLLELPIIGLIWMFSRERKQRMESSKELSSAYKGTAALLSDVLEDDDAYTGVHSREVADLSLSIALRLELNPVQLFNVEYGALLHDVGKIRVPKTILQKQGKLSPEEWKIMREHTVAGEEMLSMIGGSLSSVGRIVRHSHERYDGSGYPDGLVGADIPVESRVVSAADAWNAMTTSRPYRRALSVEVAADEMKRCAGTHFDPYVVDALLHEVAGPPYSDGVLAAAKRNTNRVKI